MILAEKISILRKKNGWSQEDLAMKLGVSRQSVSKWESTASMPDLDKIVKLSELFGVSTDYLLKEEIETVPETLIVYDEVDEKSKDEASDNPHNHSFSSDAYGFEQVRNVTLEEANTFMDIMEHSAKKIAAGVVLCIASVALLILVCGMTEEGVINITEDMAAGAGLSILFLLIACAVAIFIRQGMQLDKYEYMEKELLELDYGIAGFVENKRREFEPVYKNCITVGVTLCICSIIPLMIAAAFSAAEIVYIYCLFILMLLVALGVFLFIWSGMIYGSYQKLLEEGDYTREKKLENKRNSNLSRVYWCIIIAIYLGFSFMTMKWHISWIIWPCAGVLYAAVCGIAAMTRRK